MWTPPNDNDGQVHSAQMVKYDFIIIALKRHIPGTFFFPRVLQPKVPTQSMQRILTSLFPMSRLRRATLSRQTMLSSGQSLRVRSALRRPTAGYQLARSSWRRGMSTAGRIMLWCSVTSMYHLNLYAVALL